MGIGGWIFTIGAFFAIVTGIVTSNRISEKIKLIVSCLVFFPFVIGFICVVFSILIHIVSFIITYETVETEICHTVTRKGTDMFLGCKTYYLVDEEGHSHTVRRDKYLNSNIGSVIRCETIQTAVRR